MTRRLPPLNAVRAFEAAARHESFALAADELAVTPSAVSQQVKTLEDILGRPLFQRHARGLTLSPEGRRYLPALSESLDRIAEATHRVTAADDDSTLTVTALGSFAAMWLVPRLAEFAERHPAIDVRLSTGERKVDLTAEGFDAAIRYGNGGYEGLAVEKLLDETIRPVCSPALADRLRTPADIAQVTLLHDQSAARGAPITWSGWLRAQGVTGIDAERGPGFTDSAFLVQAAIAGRGVMLGRSVLVGDALAAGTLVAPLEGEMPAGYAYYFLTPPGALTRPKVAAFRAWLFDAAARCTAPPESPAA